MATHDIEKTGLAATMASATARKNSTDEQLLAAMGHEQELRRSFSIWSLGGLCLCLMATWEALATVVALALLSGGAPCLFYNYIISFSGTVAIVVSLAEIGSIWPTSGGQYHWVAMLAPVNQRLAASWYTGWISVGGQIVLTASAAFAGGLQMQGLIILNNADTYVPQRYHGVLLYWAVLLYSFIINVYGSKILPHANTAAGILHIAGFLIITVILGAMAPKHTASYVFVDIVNETGWSSTGLAFLIGMLSTVYPFLGYDAATHLSEEMPNPARNVPLAMVGSVLINGIIGFVFCIVLLFCIGDLETLLATPTGFPFIQLFYNVTNSYAGATIMTFILTAAAILANAAGLTSTSRTFWAFARDGAMPASRYFAHVDPKLKVPTRMIVLVSILQFLLGLIYLGSSTAFNAVLSMAILGMYLSYLLPIVYMFLYGRKEGHHAFGPFKLGRVFGPVINVVAMMWLMLAMFFSTWPNFYPVTPVNMNYSTVVLGGWLAFGTVYFTVWGRKSYSGPLMETEAVSAPVPKTD